MRQEKIRVPARAMYLALINAVSFISYIPDDSLYPCPVDEQRTVSVGQGDLVFHLPRSFGHINGLNLAQVLFSGRGKGGGRISPMSCAC